MSACPSLCRAPPNLTAQPGVSRHIRHIRKDNKTSITCRSRAAGARCCRRGAGRPAQARPRHDRRAAACSAGTGSTRGMASCGSPARRVASRQAREAALSPRGRALLAGRTELSSWSTRYLPPTRPAHGPSRTLSLMMIMPPGASPSQQRPKKATRSSSVTQPMHHWSQITSYRPASGVKACMVSQMNRSTRGAAHARSTLARSTNFWQPCGPHTRRSDGSRSAQQARAGPAHLD
mgnify:CR=1 FL=1